MVMCHITKDQSENMKMDERGGRGRERKRTKERKKKQERTWGHAAIRTTDIPSCPCARSCARVHTHTHTDTHTDRI